MLRRCSSPCSGSDFTHSSANNPSSHDRGSASLHPVCTPRDQHSASAFRMGFCESVANREYTCVSTT